MITVFVFLKAASPSAIATLGQAVADVPGVYECYSVTGDHDLFAILRVRSHDEIATVVTGGIAALPGVASTSTVIAFRTFSSDDLRNI
jgi:DNA-binding Lrp family transcriptional regulator